uniref:Secreted protein n=1 Tax=Panagrellus redivivus TaxID=6233 RepID=A0A7E4ZV34_PANRE
MHLFPILIFLFLFHAVVTDSNGTTLVSNNTLNIEESDPYNFYFKLTKHCHTPFQLHYTPIGQLCVLVADFVLESSDEQNYDIEAYLNTIQEINLPWQS